MTHKPTGYVIHRGPSEIDGGPVVVVALTGGSTNRKTGDVVQTYILRSDMGPMDAVRAGADASICGDCKHRGDGTGKGRACYVNLAHGPRAVYAAFVAGKYPDATPADVASMIAGRVVRLGTYGDPAAVPVDVWAPLKAVAKVTLGYTHQWRRVAALQSMCMASCDTADERAEAQAAGWRTFTVRPVAAPLPVGDVSCPASEEAGRRVTCDACGLCQGTTRAAKSISIMAHGIGKRHVVAR